MKRITWTNEHNPANGPVAAVFDDGKMEPKVI